MSGDVSQCSSGWGCVQTGDGHCLVLGARADNDGNSDSPRSWGEKTRQDCNRYLYGMKCRSSTCQKIPAEEIGDTVRVNHLIL